MRGRQAKTEVTDPKRRAVYEKAYNASWSYFRYEVVSVKENDRSVTIVAEPVITDPKTAKKNQWKPTKKTNELLKYLCVGGPKASSRLTTLEAPEEYHGFNSNGGSGERLILVHRSLLED